MSFPRPEQQQRAEVSPPLVVCTTAAAADFVATTLAVHGIDAIGAWQYWLYPSLGWVHGYGVTVAADREDEARDLLAALSRDDVMEPPPDGSDDEEGPRPPPSDSPTA